MADGKNSGTDRLVKSRLQVANRGPVTFVGRWQYGHRRGNLTSGINFRIREDHSPGKAAFFIEIFVLKGQEIWL